MSFGVGIGTWIKLRLLEAGQAGLSPADLFTELKQAEAPVLPGLKFPTQMRYHSFSRYFYWTKQLRWVSLTGETAIAHSRHGEVELKAPKLWFRLTPMGRAATDEDWANPLAKVHPDWGPGGVKKLAYMKLWRERKREKLEAAGALRPRGRPRRSVAPL